jgi:ubiquinone/menaquinone biosynthesis C-methylase UbiE
MKRVVIPELLDTDSGSPAEIAASIAASLSDLNRINRWFGGISTTTSMIRRVAQKLGVLSLSMLEVAAGSGYVPERARQKLVHDGIELKVTLLDRAPSHLVNGNRAIAGDVLALPFRDASFDLVGSVIFLHHLSPEQVIQSVNEALRVSRTVVLINDVVRHPMHLALVYAGLPLFRSRLTHHDAPASVRQAYTTAEIRDLLKRTSAARVEIHRHYLFRMGVMVWK